MSAHPQIFDDARVLHVLPEDIEEFDYSEDDARWPDPIGPHRFQRYHRMDDRRTYACTYSIPNYPPCGASENSPVHT